jgi:branched-chain amino acid transport system permease protein
VAGTLPDLPVGRLLPAAWTELNRTEQLVAGALLAVAVALLVAVLVGSLNPAYLAFLFALGGMFALLSMGLNAQWGFTGLINFSVAAFFGVGAYGTALMTADSSPVAGGFNPLVGLVVGIVLAVVLAILIGIPTLRLRADYLAIASLGLAEVVRLIALNERQWTNGSAGVRGVPRFFEGWPVVADLPATLPVIQIELVPGSPFFLDPIRLGRPFYGNFLDLVVVVGFLAASYVVLRRAHRSPWGRVLRTIRSDEDLAKALGKNTYWYKMQAFVFGSVVMALGGVFVAHLTNFVAPGTLEPIWTFYVWVAVMLGGSGSNRGALLGGFVVVAIREGPRHLDSLGEVPIDAAPLRLLVIGVLIVLVMRFRPQGILPPQRELIWPGTVDEPATTPQTGVREARGGEGDE